MSQIGFSTSVGGGGKPSAATRRKNPHTPNESLLLAFESYTIDPLNIEDWLTYWGQHLVEAVRSNVLYPKPCNPIVKTASNDLKWQLQAQTNRLCRPELIDPHTLHPTSPRASRPAIADKRGITSQILAASSKPQVIDAEKDTGSASSVAERTTARRRKPIEEIQQLYTHVAAISSNCAQAYGKCQNLSSCSTSTEQTNDSHLQPDSLLINVLAHQIGGLDVSLSASMGQSCKLFLEGIREIIDTIDFVCDVRHAFYKPLSEEDVATHRNNTLSIIRLLDKVNTMIVFNSDLKYYFIKLQLEALLVISWPPGSTFFANSISSLRTTVGKLLTILEETPDMLVSIDWEKEDEFLRDQYFTIMEKHYFAKRRFSNQYNSALLKKLNYHADWLKYLNEKFSSHHAPSTTESDSKNDANSQVPQKKGTEEVRYRRYRDSKDLIIDLTNHLLHINNSRTKFMRLTMMNDIEGPSTGTPRSPTITTEDSVKILENILRHQIAGLDIALSSEIFNSIKCFLHGLYDTSCSIMNIMSERYYHKTTHGYLPLSSAVYTGSHAGDGDSGESESESREIRVRRIQKSLQACKEIISRKKPKWKHTLLKLQLEALLITQCSPDTEIFREYLEIMAGTAESAYDILNHQWFIPYLSISWDDASAEDQQVFYSYWELLDTCL